MKNKTGKRNKRQFVYIVFVIIIIFLNVDSVYAENEQNQMINEQYKASGVDEIIKVTDQILDNEVNQIIPDFNIEQLTEDLSRGKFEFNFEYLTKKILSFFMKEVYINIKIMIQLIVITIICGVLTNLQSSFGKEGVSEIAFFACYVFLIGIMIRSFTYVIAMGREVIDNMVMFMQAMIPVMITLLMSVGNITTATIFQPVILFSVQIIGTIIKNFSLPVLFFATALSMVNNISDQFHISNMVNFLKQINKWSLGIILTVFVGVMTVQGFASSVVDGVVSKTTKYAVNNFVPIVGGVLSDAVDTVLGCSLILKNAIGIVGVVIVALICLVPALKILALIIVYRFTAAVIEPVSDERVVKCINDLGDSLTMVFTLVLAVALMFLISITIIIGAGNITAMFR